MEKIKTLALAVSPYFYAAAVRASTTRTVDSGRAALVRALSSEYPAVAEVLASPVGDALIRLALAGAMQLRPAEGRLATIQADLQQELLISSAAAGCEAIFSAIETGVLALVDAVHPKLDAAETEGS